jgi:enoyl-CoA hydratase/carnithine racemase
LRTAHYLVEEGAGLEKALALAGRIAGNAPLTNYAVLQVLPRIAESDQASGLMTEALMAAIAQSDPAAKQRLKDFLEKRAAKVGEIKD